VVPAAGLCVQDDGSKRTIRGVFRRLKRLGYEVETIWREIGRLAVKTIIAIFPELKVEHENEIPNVRPGLSCFQVTFMSFLNTPKIYQFLRDILQLITWFSFRQIYIVTRWNRMLYSCTYMTTVAVKGL